MKSSHRFLRSPVPWVLLTIVAVIVVSQLVGSQHSYEEIPTSQAVSMINGNTKLKQVTLTDGDQIIRITDKNDKQYRSYWVGDQSQELIKKLDERVADKTVDEWKGENPGPSVWKSLLINVVPFLIILALFIWMINAAQGMGGRGGVMGFGKSKAKVGAKDTPKTTFADVAGCQEAIEELQEIREFLAESDKFRRVGAKVPKGVLLYGPPGTGKTLLARAVAGEAGVPFFSISGSDFVEMFVGVGASRVRDLFEQAKEASPAIIFIDEIDAVGRHRGAGMGGGHDEREQTLNQLLVEMDGFDVNTNVILIAATNRPDVLDPALLRPGRFDRQIAVEAPDMEGRLKILQVHAKGKPMANDVDLTSIARRTPGMTGADLANVLNEAALLTARENLPVIGNAELDEAIDRVIAGPQKKTRIMNEHERLVTAYHEGGHALVAAAMPGTDPVQKITILPRGRALGYTMVMPDADKYSQTRGELLDSMAYMMGGRAAEELIFHDPSTGASNDIEKATKVARAMVTQYGLSAAIGTVQLGSGDSEPFLGMTAGQQRDYSDVTAKIVDDEVRELLENAHQEAFDCLIANRGVLDELVRQLFRKETLGKQEVEEIFKPLKRWPERGAFTGSDRRIPSDQPPVTPPAVEGVDDDAPVTPGPRHSELPPNPGQHSPTSPGSAPQPPSGQEDPSGWEPPHDWRPPSWGGPEETPGNTTP
ncbi:ATP-dependent zinc metalloprotease FtsH [Cutibacterium granulosum]|uniref:ATP-dependent zinc metalloprotease FtsH n=1 Tax=Cutibacterium granulosum TaxID=33011 RepID=UPI002B22F400|nr:ATP-dependent zinc metalloprotease FtsH [Cutibacterium granulosum]MEA5638451.1 ATP-dependent zinc metalloprotease FtsH [Cutibacterium granulosum]